MAVLSNRPKGARPTTKVSKDTPKAQEGGRHGGSGEPGTGRVPRHETPSAPAPKGIYRESHIEVCPECGKKYQNLKSFLKHFKAHFTKPEPEREPEPFKEETNPDCQCLLCQKRRGHV